MSETANLHDLVQSRIDSFLRSREPILAQVGADLAPFSAFSREFLSGGKRFRASFCYWGWNSVPRASANPSDDLEAVVSVAGALEIFHAAALIHDDLIDNSDTRRGAPAAHRRFESLHRNSGWEGDGDPYGRAAAILLGDLLLGWSDELLDEGLAFLPQASRLAARAEFVRMRTEVTAGQYLDILEESAWRSHPEAEQLARAEQVLTYKSAKYSVESPLVIGALLAGGSERQVAALRAFGLPLGIAFQLRDDLLGVFGDADVTGKPSGDDLLEGKRTVLVALARTALPPTARRIFDELLGDAGLTADQVSSLQATIRESGAVEKVESMISENVGRATEALHGAALSENATARLLSLAEAVTRRSH
ncbi:MAG TPA: polyprenyl synthetase family protein [Mycetocola sp.]|uniref:polyprenyl synthetase family protein n=1 Tax=Mycetocola sp. TaxID=1871042 RepID=UPI0026269D76|nr:polyprenyl synthetase family protein [Mycetocola sp.]MCU1419640.1 geranylgeranyl pyrophosphate synthase [Mycetocola sp.]MCU1560659.1 geranylgeranyl pyrophosphate synthase [Mycetocola sp.]HEV7848371.1 polyprenyl synthetase family protein [Mycetocola sp.]